MSIEQVFATAVHCEHRDPPPTNTPCESRLLLDDPTLTTEQALRAAAERGYGTDPLRCPRHR